MGYHQKAAEGIVQLERRHLFVASIARNSTALSAIVLFGSGSLSITVDTNAAVRMAASGPASATRCRGTIHFTDSDKAASVPGDHPFKVTEAGIRPFKMTFKTLGYQTLTMHGMQDSTPRVSPTVFVN